MEYPTLSQALRFERLTPPTGKIRVLLDTDTYNEVDDQFAVVHALLSPDRIELEAICAAPFHNNRSDSPADGMEKSYDEILRLLERMGVTERDCVYKGSDRYLPSRSEPVESEAARQIVERANSGNDPLYVTPIGAITNVASAILMDPSIVQKIVVVWLGGQPMQAPSAREFNLKQDVPAGQVIFDSGVPFVQVPCRGVSSHLLTTVAEMEQYVKPHGAIGQFLFETFETYRNNQFARSKEIWDISATGWLIDADWVPSTIVPSPILTDQVTWSFDARRHGMRVADMVNRDAIFGDLFRKLEQLANGDLSPSWQ
ncbi:MAG: nucleoside hydrolase [Gemmatimonadetes bacterium]|nr:nucleoside hydrolase [Gemmatimonadota bacterium]